MPPCAAPPLQAAQPELEEAKQAAAASEAALELAQGRSVILEKSWTAAASDARAQLVRAAACVCVCVCVCARALACEGCNSPGAPPAPCKWTCPNMGPGPGPAEGRRLLRAAAFPRSIFAPLHPSPLPHAPARSSPPCTLLYPPPNTQAFLDSVAAGVIPSMDAVAAVPNTIMALCLNSGEPALGPVRTAPGPARLCGC